MQSNKLLLFTIILAACLGQFASDIYTPSLPAIALNLQTSINSVQWSMAIYMLGVAISQLFYGPISEGVGRKAPLSIGLSIMLVGSLVCLFAPNIHILILGRFIQGCGAGACSALWRSVFRDIFTGEQLAKIGSYFAILVTFIVPTAPMIGGYLQHYFDWRANFVFMSIYGLFALGAIIFYFKETSQHHHPERLRFSYIFPTFKQLLTSRIFMGVTACTFLTFGSFLAWFTAGPVLLIKQLGFTPVEFGWFTFFGGGLAYALAGWLNGRLVTRYGMPAMLRLGWSVIILSGFALLLGKYCFGVNTYAITLPIILFYFGSTFIWPNCFATAFTPFGKIAGYAGALYGFMQVSGGAVLSGIVSHLPDNNQSTLALIILITAILAWSIYESIVKPSLS